jgi:hypothetical protein
MQKAWEDACSALSEKEKILFESHACDGLQEYLHKIEAACASYRDQSTAFKVLDWFEPVFKTVELFVPAAAAAVQAYPNPGSLVLGGIVGILSITHRFKSFQKLSLQMLSRMGRKMRVLLQYDREIYQDEYPRVQAALIAVYTDIIIFCLRAFRMLDRNGQLKAKVKGMRLILFRDFESALGGLLQKFEDDLEDLESEASMCDKRRLEEIRSHQVAQSQDLETAVGQVMGRFARSDEILMKLERRNQEIRERKCLKDVLLRPLTISHR